MIERLYEKLEEVNDEIAKHNEAIDYLELKYDIIEEMIEEESARKVDKAKEPVEEENVVEATPEIPKEEKPPEAPQADGLRLEILSETTSY